MGAPFAQAMMAVGTPERASARPDTAPRTQAGRVDSISLASGKIVISGVMYAYNPLSTVFMVNGKRGTISDIHPGDSAQFQQAQQGAGKVPLLTSLSVRR